MTAGERLQAHREDGEWPGWWWVTNADGRGGWLPAVILSPTRAGPVRATSSFDTRELTAPAGAIVSRLDGLQGWSLCQTASGSIGWLPDDHLAPIETGG